MKIKNHLINNYYIFLFFSKIILAISNSNFVSIINPFSTGISNEVIFRKKFTNIELCRKRIHKKIVQIKILKI